jgi:actin-like ATPase involved in cell morphogenesis
MEKKHFEIIEELRVKYIISITDGSKIIEFNCKIEEGEVFTENEIDKTSTYIEFFEGAFGNEGSGSFYSTELNDILENYNSVTISRIKK